MSPATTASGTLAGRPHGRGDTVLLLGNYRPSLTVIRTLAAEGRAFIVGIGVGEPGSEQSCHVKEIWRHPGLDDGGESLLRALTALLDARRDIGTILPLFDPMVLFLARHRDATAPLVTVASPSPEIVATCADKLRTLTLAHSLGVSTHPFAVVHDGNELRETAGRIGYPLVFRPLEPNSRLFARKALIVKDAPALEETFAQWPEDHEALLVQRFAAGGRRTLDFAARRGTLIACMECRILRTTAQDGTGVSVLEETTAPTPALLDDTRRLVRALDYTGVGFTQFILAPDGDGHSFIEMDARLSGSHAVPEAAGVPLTRLALALAEEKEIPGEADGFGYREGLLGTWTFGDLSGLKRALLGSEITAGAALRRLGQIAATAWRADAHMTWSLRDPLPTLAMFLHGLFRVTLPVWGRHDAGSAKARRAK